MRATVDTEEDVDYGKDREERYEDDDEYLLRLSAGITIYGEIGPSQSGQY